MLFKEVFLRLKNRIKKLFPFKSNFRRRESVQRERLTSLPGIGENNSKFFYEAGYTTPESIILAKDEDLMSIPGVGIAFIKKLREHT
tara:strand:+ start:3352 stop:3612 length:261 start_codon:yes stop_codon:yes gene_type:complete